MHHHPWPKYTVDVTCNAGDMVLLYFFPLIALILPLESYLHACGNVFPVMKTPFTPNIIQWIQKYTLKKTHKIDHRQNKLYKNINKTFKRNDLNFFKIPHCCVPSIFCTLFLPLSAHLIFYLNLDLPSNLENKLQIFAFALYPLEPKMCLGTLSIYTHTGRCIDAYNIHALPPSPISPSPQKCTDMTTICTKLR